MNPPEGSRFDVPGPVRVLSLGGGSAVSTISSSLSGAGYIVQTCADTAALPDDAGLGEFDAIVLDLTPEGLTDEMVSGLAERIGRLGPRRGSRPFVVGLTADGHPPDARIVEADAWTAPDRAVQDVGGALATLRLEDARHEIERLRRAVMHARRTSHDMAQPLTTVLARSQLLMRKIDASDPNHRAVAVICQEADRLAQLLEQFQEVREIAGPSRFED